MLRLRELYEIWKQDNSLQQAWRDGLEMLRETEVMFGEAVRALRETTDEAGASSIYEADRRVNELQRLVRRKVLKYLAVTGGVHVIPGLTLASIVIDMERIGDFAKNIQDLALLHAAPINAADYEARIAKIESAIREVFSRVIPIVEASARDEARALIDEHYLIRKDCDAILAELVRERGGRLGGEAIILALYIRYLKRVAAHLFNILSSVVNPFESIGFREPANTKSPAGH